MSPLDTLEMAFRSLVTGPKPLALDGRRLDGLPARMIPLDELGRLLLEPSTSYRTRDAALSALVRRAQAGQPAWVVGLAGVLLPGLRRAAGRAAKGYRGDVSDLDAELLAGLLEAIARIEPEGGRLAARLLWAAYRRAARYRRQEQAESQPRIHSWTPQPPQPPWGHPDLLLAEAVEAGVIDARDAELISATRLGEQSLQDLAADAGIKTDTLRHQRRRAELRVAAWLAA